MTKVSVESADTDEIQPQQVTYYDLSSKHVHWDRITAAALTMGAITFWAWGQQREPTPATSSLMERNSGSNLALHAPAETVALAVLPQPSPPPVRGSSSFLEPQAGATVGASLSVKGIIKGVPEDRHLWLVTRRDERAEFWPKERILPESDGSFEQKTWDYGPDGRLSLCVLSTSDADTSRFEAWLAVGDRDDEWPALEMASGSHVLGCQEVNLVKHVHNDNVSSFGVSSLGR